MRDCLYAFELQLPLTADGDPMFNYMDKFDVRYRCYDLLYKSALYAWIRLTHGNFKDFKAQEHGSVYYESSISFLNDIELSLQKECSAILALRAMELQTVEDKFFTDSSLRVLAEKDNIVMLCQFLLGNVDVCIPKDSLNLFDIFNYGVAAPFFKVVARWKYSCNRSIVNEIDSFSSDWFSFPRLHRRGYTVVAEFMKSEGCEPNVRLAYDVLPEKDMGILRFLSQISYRGNCTTDSYLQMLSACAISDIQTQNNYSALSIASDLRALNSKASFLDAALYQNYFTFIMKSRPMFANSNGSANLLVGFLADVYKNTMCDIGPFTSKLLTYLLTTSYLYGESVDIVNALLANKPLKTKTAGLEILREGSLFYVAPKQVCAEIEAGVKSLPTFAEYSLEAVKEKLDPKDGETEPLLDGEQPDETTSPDPDEETPPGEKVPGSEPTPDEETPPEDAPPADGEPEQVPEDVNNGGESEDEPPVTIVVPKNSCLFRIRKGGKTSVDDYLYIVEVSNIISRVLENPPATLKDTHKHLLTKLMTEYLYYLDVESIESLLSGIIKGLPKPTIEQTDL